MIDHVTLRVSNIEKTKEFYSKVLGVLGYSLAHEGQGSDGVRFIGFAKDRHINTWFSNEQPVAGPVHVAWVANSKEEVNEFYRVALEQGGTDNGKPGTRENYHSEYYGAFVLDHDCNNIEAVFGNYQTM